MSISLEPMLYITRACKLHLLSYNIVALTQLQRSSSEYITYIQVWRALYGSTLRESMLRDSMPIVHLCNVAPSVATITQHRVLLPALLFVFSRNRNAPTISTRISWHELTLFICKNANSYLFSEAQPCDRASYDECI